MHTLRNHLATKLDSDLCRPCENQRIRACLENEYAGCLVCMANRPLLIHIILGIALTASGRHHHRSNDAYCFWSSTSTGFCPWLLATSWPKMRARLFTSKKVATSSMSCGYASH